MLKNVQLSIWYLLSHLLRTRHRCYPVITPLQDQRGDVNLLQIGTQIILLAERSHHVHSDVHVHQWIIVQRFGVLLLVSLVPVERHDFLFKALELCLCCLPGRFPASNLPQFFATLPTNYLLSCIKVIATSPGGRGIEDDYARCKISWPMSK